MLTSALEMIPPVGLATGLEDALSSGQRGDYLGAGMDLAMAGLPGPPIKKGIRAFHGSPHDFESSTCRRSAQARAHRLTGMGCISRRTRGWRDKQDARQTFHERVNKKAIERISVARDWTDFLASRRGDRKRTREWQERISRLFDRNRGSDGERANHGHMYEVGINADPEQFLDWDKPLSDGERSDAILRRTQGEAQLLDGV